MKEATQPNLKGEQKLLSAEESAQKDEKKQPNQKLLSAEESAQKDEKKQPN